jgi:hypothetical protein
MPVMQAAGLSPADWYRTALHCKGTEYACMAYPP